MRSILCRPRPIAFTAILLLATIFIVLLGRTTSRGASSGGEGPVISVNHAEAHDVSPSLARLAGIREDDDDDAAGGSDPDMDPDKDEEALPAQSLAPQNAGAGEANTLSLAELLASPLGSGDVEQTNAGTRPGPQLIASFDGLGEGFVGPQGRARFSNPSDNSLAVGPNHIVQIVNSRIAIYTKRGAKYNTTGRILAGPIETRTVFKGFGEAGQINGGDAVVRYDQLADRWLIVMPIFSRLPNRTNVPPPPRAGGPAQLSMAAVPGEPGAALTLPVPPPVRSGINETNEGRRRGGGGGGAGRGAAARTGAYAMCYAISTTSDPLGSYYRYEFLRPLFPDYPRPAVWPDGYYVPTSTGDTVIQKQAFVVDRKKMLRGEDATEQGMIIDGVSFLNNADVDGQNLPPQGAPNIMMADGGSQLRKILHDDGIYVWKFHVDWNDPSQTRLDGPVKIPVAPYGFLGGGQLSRAVPQPGTSNRLDSQGDKIVQRLVYRRIGNQESILAVHSVNTTAGGGGVRWYEFRLDTNRDVKLYQEGTYAPEGNFRWLPSPAMDKEGNIGMGYSFGGSNDFPGQRFAGRLAGDPLGVLTMHETVLAEGGASQRNGLRWEDYATSAMDPSDDETIWYVGDYLKKGGANYTSRIGAFRLTPFKFDLDTSVGHRATGRK